MKIWQTLKTCNARLTFSYKSEKIPIRVIHDMISKNPKRILPDNLPALRNVINIYYVNKNHFASFRLCVIRFTYSASTVAKFSVQSLCDLLRVAMRYFRFQTHICTVNNVYYCCSL